jgi:hypothetical protein
MMVCWIWNKLMCKVYGHPEQSYKITHIQSTSFFSGGVHTVGVVYCRRCNALLGRV